MIAGRDIIGKIPIRRIYMDRSRIEELLTLPLSELISVADKVRARHAGGKVELCSIMNAKSGSCGEDCKFCAQSARHATGVSAYPLKGREEILAAARRAKEIGADRFDVVTSGNRLSRREVASIAEAMSQIRDTMGMKLCASLGSLDEEALVLLKGSGLSRYHHNIETSRRYFPEIVSTHSFDDRIATIIAAKRTGLEVCSGGIIGMGETWDDRIDMALTLKELDVQSVPLNMLVPVKGTRLEGAGPLSCADAVRTIAIFRIVLEHRIIKLAAGRESVLKDFQAMAFMAGANGMLIGGYLTINGRSVEDDRALVDQVEEGWRR
jgi:biotin synthase